jgi:hypothetical protein
VQVGIFKTREIQKLEASLVEGEGEFSGSQRRSEEEAGEEKSGF